MNEDKWLSRLLGIGAVLEIPVGLALLVKPSELASILLGAPLFGTGIVVACVTLVLAPPDLGSRALSLGAGILHGLLSVGLLGALFVRDRQRSAVINR